MGILDKLKGLFKGREQQVKGGIDKVSDTLEKKVPAHATKIDAASDKAKDLVDDLDKTTPSSTTSTTAPSATSTPKPVTSTPTPSVTTPPASTPPVTEDPVTPPPTTPLP